MKLIAGPLVEPITLDEARLHLRVDPVAGPHPDDPLIAAQLSAAREWAEQYTGRFIAPRTLEAWFTAPELRAPFDLPEASRVLSLSYVDSLGETVALGPPAIALDGACLRIADAVAWPAGRAVRVVYVAGGDCPAAVRAALLLLVGSLYTNRENDSDKRVASVPFGVERLLHPYRINLGV